MSAASLHHGQSPSHHGRQSEGPFAALGSQASPETGARSRAPSGTPTPGSGRGSRPPSLPPSSPGGGSPSVRRSNGSSPAGPSPKPRRSLPPTGQPAGAGNLPPTGQPASAGKSPKKLEQPAIRQRTGPSDVSAQPLGWRDLYSADSRPRPQRQQISPTRSLSAGPREARSVEHVVSAAVPLPSRPRVSTAEATNCKKTLAGNQHISFQQSSMLASVHAINQDLPADRHLSQVLRISEETVRPDQRTLLQPLANQNERTLSQPLHVDKSSPGLLYSRSGSSNTSTLALPSATASSQSLRGAGMAQVQNLDPPFARSHLADRAGGRARSLSLGAG